jgi:hypothetical protein
MIYLRHKRQFLRANGWWPKAFKMGEPVILEIADENWENLGAVSTQDVGLFSGAKRDNVWSIAHLKQHSKPCDVNGNFLKS